MCVSLIGVKRRSRTKSTKLDYVGKDRYIRYLVLVSIDISSELYCRLKRHETSVAAADGHFFTHLKRMVTAKEGLKRTGEREEK